MFHLLVTRREKLLLASKRWRWPWLAGYTSILDLQCIQPAVQLAQTERAARAQRRTDGRTGGPTNASVDRLKFSVKSQTDEPRARAHLGLSLPIDAISEAGNKSGSIPGPAQQLEGKKRRIRSSARPAGACATRTAAPAAVQGRAAITDCTGRKGI